MSADILEFAGVFQLLKDQPGQKIRNIAEKTVKTKKCN